MPVQIVSIIEDEPAIRRFIRFNLERQGYQVEEAGDGEKGLALLKHIKPDLLILDYRLPLMNGEEILTAMLADAVLKTVPVILLSASMTVSANSFPNVCVHLVKPVDIRTLLMMVQQFLPAVVA